jgi:hypothetical protein
MRQNSKMIKPVVYVLVGSSNRMRSKYFKTCKQENSFSQMKCVMRVRATLKGVTNRASQKAKISVFKHLQATKNKNS